MKLKKTGVNTLLLSAFLITLHSPIAHSNDALVHLGKINSFNYPPLNGSKTIKLKASSGELIELQENDAKKLGMLEIVKYDRRRKQIYFHHDEMDQVVSVNRRDVSVTFYDKPKVTDPALCEEIRTVNASNMASRMSSNDLRSLLASCN